MQRFINNIDHHLLNNIFGECNEIYFEAEEDRVAETWYIWTGYIGEYTYTITHKLSGFRYDGPSECFDDVYEMFSKERIKELI
jgi:hypothetical protein